MRSLLLTSIFGLVLLAGQDAFLNSFAFARHTANHCCMCPSCYTWCWCGGQANCPKCRSNEGDGISTVSVDSLTLSIRQIISARTLRVIDADSIERVVTVVRGNRLLDKSSVTLIDHVEDYMRFRCQFVSFWADTAAVGPSA
jgi:hypothetical protein